MISQSEIKAAWERTGKRISRLRRTSIDTLVSFLNLLENPHARLLTYRWLDRIPDQQSADELFAIILRAQSTGRATRLEVSNWLSILRAVTGELSKAEPALALTTVGSFIPPRESPFARTQDIASLRAIHYSHALQNWIVTTDFANRSDCQCAALISAILFGALLDTTKVKHLHSRLIGNLRPHGEDGARAFEFRLPFSGIGDLHLQRWIADPLTEMLIYRIPADGADLSERNPAGSIRDFLERAGVSPSFLPKRLNTLIHDARALWAHKIPVLDLHCVGRQIQSHAIHGRTWYRLQGICPPAAKSSPRTGANDKPPLEEGDPPEYGAILAVFEPIMTLVDAEDLETIAATATRHLAEEGLGESDCLYLGWISWLAEGHSRSGKPLQPSTLRQRVQTTLPRLIEQFGEANPASLHLMALEEIYGELANLPQQFCDRRALISGLADFHEYLVKKHGVERLRDETSTFGEGADRLPVDSNLISHDDYRRAREWIDRQALAGWSDVEIRETKLFLLLALRGGLRRMEIAGLRLDDIDRTFRISVSVEPYPLRGLKTTNSRRQVPIDAFLDADEKAELRAWIRDREIACANDDGVGYLFPDFVRDGDTVNTPWIDKLTGRVISAIRAATGDARIFLHHLRHAFATWTFMALLAPELPQLVRHFEHLPETARFLSRGNRIRRCLELPAKGPDRHAAYAVAKLLGHSSPWTSLGHYIHAADVVLGVRVWNAAAELAPGVLIAASGLGKSAAYELIGRGIASLLTAVRRRVGALPAQRLTADESSPQFRGRPRKIPSEQPNWIPLSEVGQLIGAIVEAGRSHDEVAELSGRDRVRVAAMAERARDWLPLLGRGTDTSVDTATPPRTAPEIQFESELEVALAKLASESPALYRAGLEIALLHFNRQKGDIVFKGKAELSLARKFLRFVARLNLSTRTELTLRRPPGDALDLPEWFFPAQPARPATTRRLTPPSPHPSYRQHVGVRFLDHTGRAVGRIAARAIALAWISFADAP